MATEVLRPQDCLIGSHQGFPRRKPIHGGVSNPRINRKSKAGQSDPAVSKSNPVTILRRGESLDGGRSKGRMGRNLGDVYAGSGFLSTSPPPPSSLPLPSFSTRKSVVDDSATRDLRRLLRLE
uniref:Uncharacterized protein n=1 Tax=Kalanchoe fedtschenkoi TaxID=63787 RepID=A0A7N0V5G4_KALFE